MADSVLNPAGTTYIKQKTIIRDPSSKWFWFFLLALLLLLLIALMVFLLIFFLVGKRGTYVPQNNLFLSTVNNFKVGQLSDVRVNLFASLTYLRDDTTGNMATNISLRIPVQRIDSKLAIIGDDQRYEIPLVFTDYVDGSTTGVYNKNITLNDALLKALDEGRGQYEIQIGEPRGYVPIIASGA